MKKVIDANYFQDPALENYLRADVSNKVVFTDYAGMEMYKGNAIKNVYNSIQIVSRYPKQVIILKHTSPAVKIGGISNDPQECLEDPIQTREFSRFCYGVRLAAQGNKDLASQILRYGKFASQHLDGIPTNPEQYAQAINDIRRSFDAEELTALRKREPLPLKTCEKIVHHIFLHTAFLFGDHVGRDIDRVEIANLQSLKNTFIFRFAISSFLMVLRWISDGGLVNVKTKKLRNDIVDMGYVSYATFFDGILTKEKKVQEIYEESCFFLDEAFSPS